MVSTPSQYAQEKGALTTGGGGYKKEAGVQVALGVKEKEKKLSALRTIRSVEGVLEQVVDEARGVGRVVLFKGTKFSPMFNCHQRAGKRRDRKNNRGGDQGGRTFGIR